MPIGKDVDYNSPAGEYWLYRWMDEYEIRKIGDLPKAVRRPHAIERLRELQKAVDPRRYYGGGLSGESLLAGRRIDLSGFQGCSHFECVVPQIDKLFGKTWHYFDTIVVDDPYRIYSGDQDSESFFGLKQRIDILLHLRKIGADKYIAFKKKPAGFCQMHFRKLAEDQRLGLDVLLDEKLADTITRELVSGGTIELRQFDGEDWHYTIKHPRLELITGTYAHSDGDVRPSAEEIARDAFGWYCTGLISDAATARALHIPLIQAAETELFSERPDTQIEKNENEIVALKLRLPVLMNVSAKEILNLKNENWPEFERFRSALRKAIREQIDNAGTKSPQEVANTVVQEYVNPELADIERRLGVARKGLARKIGAGVSLGGATVTAGAIASIPLVLATGVAAVATSLPQVYKYFEDKNQVELSDLYFLWKARVKHNN